ncbi:MAG: YraN family protein [Candidatus Paceibacterota bacterium]|jgi:putative endonuclease
MPTAKETGQLGEQMAIEYLENKGYEILDRNYVFRVPQGPPMGEIDIVAKKNKIVVFVEVKTLRVDEKSGSEPLIRPEEKVNYQKMRKLARAAENWLIKNEIGLDKPWQIDIIAVKIFIGRTKIVHFENAVSNFQR